jgi:hypothetical protein
MSQVNCYQRKYRLTGIDGTGEITMNDLLNLAMKAHGGHDERESRISRCPDHLSSRGVRSKEADSSLF